MREYFNTEGYLPVCAFEGGHPEMLISSEIQGQAEMTQTSEYAADTQARD